MKPRVYIETTIPSYLSARPSRDVILTGNQQITRQWWSHRDEFELFVSQVVVEEAEDGDPAAAAERLATLAGIPLLDLTPSATYLAANLMKGVPLPRRASTDALYIAISAVHRVDYLVTWNCAHIANVILRPRIESICRAAGYRPPLICTPAQLSEWGDADD